ncbi:MAG: lipopolysaccharide heptosyltransferase II [Lentisphaerae bacterium]|nr:lipopolysaccharide heptosyltransferase II [Lentisphaerota bacterium]
MRTDTSESLTRPPRRVAVCAPNWLGDCIMAMPALQAFCRRTPGVAITVLTKPGLVPLWRMHADVGAMVELHEGSRGAGRAARALAAAGVEVAYVLPNSFRSALIPMLARIAPRVGLRGHRPPVMLTRVVQPPAAPGRKHQVWEYLAIFGAADVSDVEPPRLQIPAEAAAAVASRFGLGRGAVEPVIGILPGAAYGPSKRWPATHFIRAARALVERAGVRVLVLGSKGEQSVCAEVAAGIGPRAMNLAGATTLPELAAVLADCRVVICNDSGGMHLSAAVGTPVVAIFGLTDPGKTGPLGTGHRLVQREGVVQSRDLKRDSPEAREVLASITPERVITDAMAALAAGRRP